MQVETVAEQLLFSTLRIQAIFANGTESIGTGSIVNHKSGERLEEPFLVTNFHVVKDTVGGQVTFTLADGLAEGAGPLLGESIGHSIGPAAWNWVPHPKNDVDIAVLALAPSLNYLDSINRPPFIRGIPTTFVPSSTDIEEFDAMEDIVFIGYPNGIYDHANNLPIIRKGITATPVTVDYNAESAFLIDASVFPGSSGSPVFLHRHGSWPTRTGTVVGGERIHFLGVLSSVYYREEQGSLELREIPTAVKPIPTSKEMIDLGVVQKAHTVVETIEHFISRREQKPLQSVGGLLTP